MQVIRISINGVEQVHAKAVTSKSGIAKYYTVLHGEEGRGRWQLWLPLPVCEFPVKENSILLEGEFALEKLLGEDQKGNPLFLLRKGEQDDKFLVFWSLNPGFRGGAKYSVSGQAQVIALGEEAQGDAGYMGGAVCPLVLATGPCSLTWHRTGRLYGSPADWTATYDGDTWTVCPSALCALEDAALNY